MKHGTVVMCMPGYRSVWVKNVSGKRKSKCNVSEKEVCLVYLRNSKEPVCPEQSKSDSGSRIG